MPGCKAVETVNSGDSQCPVRTSIALGIAGREAGILRIASEVFAYGMRISGIYGHGPPPWDMKNVGSLLMRLLSLRYRHYPAFSFPLWK